MKQTDHDQEEEWSEDEEELANPEKQNSLSVVNQIWSPRQLPVPVIDRHLEKRSWPERCAEVIRYSILRLEHWVSRGGWIREWIRINLWIGLILSTAALLIVPPLTAVLRGTVEFTGLFGDIIENLTSATMKLPPVVIGIATLLVVFRYLYRHWWIRRGRRQSDRSYGFEEYR